MSPVAGKADPFPLRRPPSPSDILTLLFRLYRTHFLPALGVILPFALTASLIYKLFGMVMVRPTINLGNSLLWGADFQFVLDEMGGLIMVALTALVIKLLLYPLPVIAGIHAFHELMSGGRPTIASAWRQVRRSYLRWQVAYVAVFLLSTPAFFLFALPAIPLTNQTGPAGGIAVALIFMGMFAWGVVLMLLSIRYYLISPIAALEDYLTEGRLGEDSKRIFLRAHELGRGMFFTFLLGWILAQLAVYFILLVLLTPFSLLISLITGTTSPEVWTGQALPLNPVEVALQQGLTLVAEMIVAPFLPLLHYLLYLTAKSHHEAYDLELHLDYLRRIRTTQAEEEEKGMPQFMPDPG